MAKFRNITADTLTALRPDGLPVGPDEVLDLPGDVVDEIDDAYVLELPDKVLDGYDVDEQGNQTPRYSQERRLLPKSTWSHVADTAKARRGQAADSEKE